MNINSIRYTTRQSLLSFRRNLWLALISATMIAISLGILGGFLLLVVNTNQFMRNIESNVEVIVFLQDGADAQEVSAQLDGQEEIKDYTFVSKHDGLKEFGIAMGDSELLSGLEGENNPLPDMFRVRAQQAEAVPALAGQIATFTGVESVDYGEELVDRLMQATGWVNTFSLGISTLLAIGAVFLIMTTIRLSVMARQDEVGIMKYLGASNWFIRFPFLMEGMLMGSIGTLAAVGALGLIYYQLAQMLLRETVFFLQPVTGLETLVPIFAGLLLLGILMGGLGSLVSIRKFLRV